MTETFIRSEEDIEGSLNLPLNTAHPSALPAFLPCALMPTTNLILHFVSLMHYSPWSLPSCLHPCIPQSSPPSIPAIPLSSTLLLLSSPKPMQMLQPGVQCVDLVSRQVRLSDNQDLDSTFSSVEAVWAVPKWRLTCSHAVSNSDGGSIQIFCLSKGTNTTH